MRLFFLLKKSENGRGRLRFVPLIFYVSLKSRALSNSLDHTHYLYDTPYKGECFVMNKEMGKLIFWNENFKSVKIIAARQGISSNELRENWVPSILF